MPDDTPFPDYLFPIIDAAVAHVLDGAPLPPHLEELESWLELNDPECLCENYTELVPKGLLEEKFVDDEVRERMCVDENSPLTDQDRLDFAKSFINKLLRDGPSWGTFEGIHSYGIKDSRGRSALLGIRMYGPGGQHGFHEGRRISRLVAPAGAACAFASTLFLGRVRKAVWPCLDAGSFVSGSFCLSSPAYAHPVSLFHSSISQSFSYSLKSCAPYWCFLPPTWPRPCHPAQLKTPS